MSMLSAAIDKDKLRKAGIRGRKLTDVVKHGLGTMAAHWHATYLPLHFLESAYQRYGYTRRKGVRDVEAFRVRRAAEVVMGHRLTADELEREVERFLKRSYTARKIRRWGADLPLVFSGQTRTLARWPDIRVTRDKARVVLPRGLNRRHPESTINMRDEVTRIIPSERRTLVRIAREAVQKRVRELKNS